MKIKIAVFAIITLTVSVYASQETTRNVWDGVYTEAQAKAGQANYRESCSMCHGESLGGGEEAPELAGSNFMSNWNGLTVGDLSERIRISMPPQSPGSLSRQQTVEVIAFILSANNFPVGKTELPQPTDQLKQIKITASK